MVVRARLLGPFSVSDGERTVDGWPRPSARRLCELVLVSPGRRVSRDLVCEELFVDLDPRAAARAVSKALSMARAALTGLPDLLEADLTHIWAAPSVEVDVDEHQTALHAALAAPPGQDRDDRLVAALAENGELLADEPYADWAIRPRDRLEALRQQARLALARDRAKGAGRTSIEAVIAAWADCFEHDPASEEAAIALVGAYSAQGRREDAAVVFERCASALDELGLRVSGTLEEAYAAAAAPSRSPASTAEELRTVSVLVAEVAVPAGDDLDLERRREIVAASVAAMIAEAEALGGTVTSVSGTGVQAVFGAPLAHEDDPERAVRAAFRASTAATALRIGIETGPAVLGPIGGGGKVEYAAVGAVVTTAAALQSRAATGSVLVGPVTRAAVRHLFTWGPDGRLGVPRPGIQISPRKRGALVGRRAELAVLGAAMRDASRGDGSVVVVTGEPGMGKTRLVQEFRDLAGSRPLWLEGRCASYASATPYSVYQQLLANWCGVTPELPETVVRPALERALSRVKAGHELLPPLARMMGLSPGAALGRKAPEEVQRAMFAAWRDLLSRLVTVSPVVVVLEDLHWADPTSRHLTEHLARLASGRPLLLILTSRPGGAPEIGRQVALGPLSGAAERALARSLIGEDADPEILDAVLASVAGNPLFLEERLSSLLETEALVRERGTWRLNEQARQEVPQVLERLVRARVDRLSPAARDVIRNASVLGPEFPLSLLAAVTSADLPLEPIMAELRARDLLHEVDGSFRFRHAVIQEATYSGLLGGERRRLHGRAAWALEAASRDRLDDVAAVLGRHFAAAGERDRALLYLEMAGDHATSAFANDEAIASFRAAMALTQDPDLRVKVASVLWRTGRRVEAKQAFHEALGLLDGENTLRRAHMHTRLGRLEMADLRFDAAKAEYAAAEALLGNDTGRMDAATAEEWLELMVDGRSALHHMLDEPERVLEILEAVRPVLETRGSPARKYGFYMHLAYARVMRKRYRVAESDIAVMRQGLAAARHSVEAEKDAGYATYFLGWLLWLNGDLETAQELLDRALATAERIGESVLTDMSTLGLAMNGLRRHDPEAVRVFASRTAWAGARACLVWLAWQEKRPDDALALAGELAEAEWSTPGYLVHNRWVYLWPLLAIHLDAGRIEDAAAVAGELLDPGQHQLPDVLESALRAEGGLPRALALARGLRYC